MGMFDTLRQAPTTGPQVNGTSAQKMSLPTGADQFQQKQKMRANPLMRGRPNMNRQVMNQPAQGIPRVRPPVNNTPLPPMQGLAPTQLPTNPSAGLPPIQSPLDRQMAPPPPVPQVPMNPEMSQGLGPSFPPGTVMDENGLEPRRGPR